MDKEKVAALFADEAFVKELATKETPEDAQKLFAGKGVTVSVDELKALRVSLKQQAGEELSEDELEMVAGGLDVTGVANALGGTIVGVTGQAAGLIGSTINTIFTTRW